MADELAAELAAVFGRLAAKIPEARPMLIHHHLQTRVTAAMVTAGRADGRAGGRADGRAGGRAGGQDARSRADDNLSSSVDVAVHEKGAATSATATSDTATTIAIAAVTAGAAPSNTDCHSFGQCPARLCRGSRQ